MDKKPFVPFVPASRSMDELTLKALVLGALMAVILGAAQERAVDEIGSVGGELDHVGVHSSPERLLIGTGS